MVETLQTTSGVDFPEITKEVLDLQQNVREQKPQTKETQENKEEITYANLNEHLNKRANEITQEIEQKGNPLPEEEKMKRNLKILEVSNESKSAFEVNSWGGSIGIEFVNRFGYSPDSFPDTLIPRTPEQTESIFIHHKV
ncbi:MAG: hypothetical protein LBO09_06355 [Candidatus Peribacteria bacterium]|jgi:hypothetical protein|nr:hypothetical protein [Candidatus Peribacteria bacterium]